MIRSRAGMTLIELVVALAIAAAAIASGYQAYATIADRRAMAVERADAMVRAFTLRATLAAWIANARLTIEEDEVLFRGVDGERRLGRDEPPSADLVFLTSAPSAVGSRGTVVHLFVAHDSGERGLVAELTEWRGRRTARLLLDPAIDRLSVEFSSLSGDHSLPTTSWVSSTILPPLIRLSFRAGRTDSLPALLRIPLTVRLDASGIGSGRGS